MEEFEFYKHNQYTKRTRMGEERAWSSSQRELYNPFANGSDGEYSRGNKKEARNWRCEDNDEYSRGNQGGSRKRRRVENEDYSRGNQRGAREQRFEEYSRGNQMGARDQRSEEIEDYSRGRDRSWDHEESSHGALDLLEKERLELCRLEEKLQSVMEEADSPINREEYDSSGMSEDEETRYSGERSRWYSEKHARRDRESPGPYRDRSRSPLFDRDNEHSSYHSEKGEPLWRPSQYQPQASHQEDSWLQPEEPQQSISYSGTNQYYSDVGELSSRHTGDRSFPLSSGMQSTPRTAKEDSNCKLIIVSVGYPEVPIGKKIQFRKLRRAILKPWKNKRWVALSEEEKQMYGIKDVILSRGKVIVICSNSHTRDWLFQYVPYMRPFKGANLKTIEEEDADNTARVDGPDRTSMTEDGSFVQFTGIFRKPLVCNEVIFKLLEVQNDGIDTSKWRVFSRQQIPNGEGIYLKISVDPLMAKVIAQKKFMLHCGYYEVHLHLQKC